MIHPSAEVVDAASSMSGQRDFGIFLNWLEASQAELLSDLLVTVNPVLVHQKQGYGQCLADIIRLATAKPNGASFSGASNA